MMSHNQQTLTLVFTLLINFLLLTYIVVKSSLSGVGFDQYFKKSVVCVDVYRSRLTLRDIYQLHRHLVNRSMHDVGTRELYDARHLITSTEIYLIQLLLNDQLRTFNNYDQDEFQKKLSAMETSISSRRGKRSTSEEPVKSGEKQEIMKEVFSTLNSGEKSKFRPPVSSLLIPALIKYEKMIIKKLEALHEMIVSHDLRLEVLEKAMLSTSDGAQVEVQADDLNNRSELENPKDIIRLEELLPLANGSALTDMKLTEDGSGETEHPTLVPTTSTHSSTQTVVTWKVPEYYEIFRHLTTVEQKVLALESYNLMSDSELNRVRSEVIKMDDKVTELDRKNGNLQVRMSMHAVKLSELELFKNKAEATLHISQDSYGRVNSRLEAFKDRLAEIKTEIRGVTSQFSRHDQISNELRAADSYKAHDIQEIRKNIFGLENRLSNLYTVLDQNIQMMQADIKSVVDRICSTNHISC